MQSRVIRCIWFRISNSIQTVSHEPKRAHPVCIALSDSYACDANRMSNSTTLGSWDTMLILFASRCPTAMLPVLVGITSSQQPFPALYCLRTNYDPDIEGI